MAYQILMGYLMPKFDSFVKMFDCNPNCIFVHLLNGISTPYGLFNAKIWFIYKGLIAIITTSFNGTLTPYRLLKAEIKKLWQYLSILIIYLFIYNIEP